MTGFAIIDNVAIFFAIVFACLTVRRLYIRVFWIQTTARIEYVSYLNGWNPINSNGVFADIVYETDKGESKGRVKLPGVDEYDSSILISNDFYWQSSLGMTVPIYYRASSPSKVIFIGIMRIKDGSALVTNGIKYDLILAVLTLACSFFVLHLR